MRQLLDLYSDILKTGVDKSDRTGVGTRSVFGRQLRFSMSDGFPAVTTKSLFWKGVVAETLWLLRGETNIKYLVDNGVNIWTDWPYKNYKANTSDVEAAGHDMAWFASQISADWQFAQNWGDLGPLYGKQWRDWDAGFDPASHTTERSSWLIGGRDWVYGKRPNIDQLAKAVEMLQTQPDSRRNIVMAWNPADIDEMAKSGLPPCHFCFQFNTRPWYHPSGPRENQVPSIMLDLHVNIRSSDVFLGLPFNIASYALILHLMASEVDLIPGDLVVTTGDTHIYKNHFAQVEEQITREPYPLPRLGISERSKMASILATSDIDPEFRYQIDDFKLGNYKRHPAIKGEVAV